MVDLAEPLGPWSSTSLLTAPARTKLPSSRYSPFWTSSWPATPARPLAVGEVEELEPACGSSGVRHLCRPEMVHHVTEVLGGIAALEPGRLEEELEVLLEGEDAAVVEEVAVHHRSHLPEEVLRAHRRDSIRGDVLLLR